MSLQKSQEENEKNTCEEVRNYLKHRNLGGIGAIDVISDAHLMDDRGMTVLHWALEDHYISPSIVSKLLNSVHPHVMTYDGLTPLDLARKLLPKSEGFSKY